MDRAKRATTVQVEADITIVMSSVADYFGPSMAELRGSKRSRTVVIPRQIGMYLAKQMTSASLQEIGDEFGGKHHSTVMHSIAKIGDLRRVDWDLDRAVRTLMGKFRPSGTQ
jgi:chromosomal replication initiator protein